MESVLNRHGSHQNHSRQNGLRAVDVMEWTELNRERGTGDQEEYQFKARAISRKPRPSASRRRISSYRPTVMLRTPMPSSPS